jgi:hypothetical protein
MLSQAKAAFAQRKEFQLHVLLAHPPQLNADKDAGSFQNRAMLLDGKFQAEATIAGIFSGARGEASASSWTEWQRPLTVLHEL